MTSSLDHEQAHLIKMVNQIAENIPTRTDVPHQVATHLRSFWTPAMRAQVEELAREQPDEFLGDVQEAIELLRSEA